MGPHTGSLVDIEEARGETGGSLSREAAGWSDDPLNARLHCRHPHASCSV